MGASDHGFLCATLHHIGKFHIPKATHVLLGTELDHADKAINRRSLSVFDFVRQTPIDAVQAPSQNLLPPLIGRRCC